MNNRPTMFPHEAFTLLGLKRGAKWDEVREAYLDLMRIWHPDRFEGDARLSEKAETHSKTLNEAFAVLKEFYENRSSPPPLQATEQPKARPKQTEVKTPVPKSNVWSAIRGTLSIAFALPRFAARLVVLAVAGWMAQFAIVAIVLMFGFQMLQRTNSDGRSPNQWGVALEVGNKAMSQFGEQLGEDSLDRLRSSLEQQQFFKRASNFVEDGSLSSATGNGNFRYISPQNPTQVGFITNELPIRDLDQLALPNPPLVQAAVRCDVGLAEQVLAAGAKLESSDLNGISALAWSIRRHCAPVTELLLKRGADPDNAAESGISPRDWVRISGGAKEREAMFNGNPTSLNATKDKKG